MLVAVDGYTPKRWHDGRSACIEPSDQGTTDWCVLEAFCGLEEARRWKLRGIKKQLDAGRAYDEAKRIDGINGPGTTLEFGLQAMINVGFISEVAKDTIRQIGTLNELKRALHRYDAVVTAWKPTTSWLNPGKDGWISAGGDPLGTGHAMLCCYFDEDERSIGCQDSYGYQHGDEGFVRMSDLEFDSVFSYGLVFDYLGS